MSLNRIIIGFIVILLLFSAFIVFQIDHSPPPPSKVTIANRIYSVELAKTTKEQQQGLSGRNSLPQDQGMLFIFNKPDLYAFWMKGMKFPLDIIFINKDKIVSISQNVPVSPNGNDTNLPVYTPAFPADRVLEINAGQAKTNNFKVGDNVIIKLK